jgi:CheY-like chemotaxis protein
MTQEYYRIVVVDDDADVRLILKIGLERIGNFQVEVYPNGQEALQAFVSHPIGYYNCILTNLQMPVMNGFQLYREIKQRNPEQLIVFLTGADIDEDGLRETIETTEVIIFFKKPIQIPDLARRIKAVIQGNKTAG